MSRGPAGAPARRVVISYVLAVLAAVTNAGSNVLNRKATREEPARDQFRLRLIWDLIRDRTWLIAVGMMILSFVLDATALGTGELAAVQIIIILELPMTLIGGMWFLGARLGMREWGAIAAMTAGVIGVLVCLNPRGGGAGTRPPLEWILGSAANGGAVAILFAAAKSSKSPARQAALLGAACGFCYGLAAAYTKGMTEHFTSGGIGGVITSWQLYAAAVAGIVATWLLENAYHAGRLAAAQPGITLLDPTAATVWGVLVFGEQVRGGLFALLAVAPLLLLAAGVVALSRSPCLRATAGASEDGSGEGSGEGSQDARPPRAGQRASQADARSRPG